METTSLCLCQSIPTTTHRFRNKKLIAAAAKRSSSSSSSSDSSLPSSSLVDESMIVLRKRIHQMKVIERNYEPPENWSHWEKQHYARYDEYVCSFVGVLQSILMNRRPSFALALIAIVAMSVPTSAMAVVLHLVRLANEALSSLNLG